MQSNDMGRLKTNEAAFSIHTVHVKQINTISSFTRRLHKKTHRRPS